MVGEFSGSLWVGARGVSVGMGGLTAHSLFMVKMRRISCLVLSHPATMLPPCRLPSCICCCCTSELTALWGGAQVCRAGVRTGGGCGAGGDPAGQGAEEHVEASRTHCAQHSAGLPAPHHHAGLPSALPPLPYAFCPLPFAPNPMPPALCLVLFPLALAPPGVHNSHTIHAAVSVSRPP